MTRSEALHRLAELYGIESEYVDVMGGRHSTPDATREKLLTAMGLAVDQEDLSPLIAAAEEREWRSVLPPVAVFRADADSWSLELTLPSAQTGRTWHWALLLEGGERRQGSFVPEVLPQLAQRDLDGRTLIRWRLVLPAVSATGYHRLQLEPAGEAPGQEAGLALGPGLGMLIVVAPPRCYWAEAVREPDTADKPAPGRPWGIAVQLYGLRSNHNWGMGDFGDLRRLIDTAAGAGAGFIGLNPLHALLDEHQASPYSPSSRLFCNPLYLDVEAVSDFQESEAAQTLAKASPFQDQLGRLRDAELVDYPQVASLKHEILRLAYAHFRQAHLQERSERAQAFLRFCDKGGQALGQYALFAALQAHFRALDPNAWGWPAWPEAYRSPQSPAVRAFAAEHAEEIEYHLYLQWLCHQQLGAAAQRAWLQGMELGLYHDMALGVNPGGAEAWLHQELYALGVHVGAPPDEFSPLGQDWGLPPLVPWRLREAGYAPYIATLRAGMRHGGVLRIDHVMALMRLFWIPAGEPAANGAYVRYPLDDLLAILALESCRQRCMVVGEDLGTVPEQLRPALAELGVLSYRPLIFERDGAGNFKPPQEYPRQALAVVSTHDLPTLAGYWIGRDIDQRARLGLLPPGAEEKQRAAREDERQRLLQALKGTGLVPSDAADPPSMDEPLSLALHAFIARTPCMMLAIQTEDIFGILDQANLPGSVGTYPNWRRKVSPPLERWAADERFKSLTEVLRRERGPRLKPAPTPEVTTTPGRQAEIPRATYRLQFNRSFTLAQGRELADYLDALGISHLYASPILKARPGSNHGYDIVDHNAINPEIGNLDDLQALSATLRRHGMGMIVDMVPNHMAVLGADNAWWLDVLENGRASPYAKFFDIDWQPVKAELGGKVLLPILGDHYGAVLSRGELRLSFDTDHGEFSLHYYGHRLPVDPIQYARIVGYRIERLVSLLGTEHSRLLELQTLLAAFSRLPQRHAATAEQIAERARDQAVHKRHLAALCIAAPDIAQHIADNVAAFNGRPGEPASFDLLHNLIKAQAYRLAYWRVASDEINYRRFFDISELAALRMENQDAFDATHRLMLALVDQGVVQGLRIDHADGLFDPRQYFWRVQSRCGSESNPSVPQGLPSGVLSLSKDLANGQDQAVAIPPNNGSNKPSSESGRDGPPTRTALPLYLVIEKILAEHERLHDDWPIHGDTGYRFAHLVDGLFIDPAAERRMSRIYESFIEDGTHFGELMERCKLLIVRSTLPSELNMLSNRLARIAAASRNTCDFTLSSLRRALADVVACFPVYRSYLAGTRLAPEDRRNIEWAVARAKKRSPAEDISVYDFIGAVLTTDIGMGKAGAYRTQVLRFVMKFQQYTAPVMAKGVEDTAFYRYHRLVSLNEVGGDPRRFGLAPNAFHAAMRNQREHWPHGLLAGSTHDSKRSEDVRARIHVLSEIPALWKLSVQRWSRFNRSRKREVDERMAPSANDEYLFYQTLFGSWPWLMGEPDEAGLDDYRQRIQAYMQKAVREAKEHTSWININEEYEAALTQFVEGALTPSATNLFLADFAPLVQRLAPYGLINSLAQTLIRLTAPGVPDLYQGSELWQFKLVDPDNRRPVDYGLRRQLFEQVRALPGEDQARWHAGLDDLGRHLHDGRIKLYLIWRVLQLRRLWPDVFEQGDYEALATSGSAAEHAVAFARHHAERRIVVVVPRLLAKLHGERSEAPVCAVDWGDTCVEPPAGSTGLWVNVLTGEAVEGGESGSGFSLAALFKRFPAALLMSDEAGLPDVGRME